MTYLAEDQNLLRQVAIKEYLPSDFANRSSDHTVQPLSGEQGETYQWGLSAFLNEARTLARFRHPNIVHIHSVFELNNTAYIVMDYESGKDLRQQIKLGHPSEADLMAILLPILDGLKKIHNAGFIHRDITPTNIRIRQDGSPVLIDFGSAREAVKQVSQSLTRITTPRYAPFEQYGTQIEQGPWTDIYALGACMFLAITGIRPIDAMDRSAAILNKWIDPQPLLTNAMTGEYSREFLEAIEAALRFRIEDRPQSIEAWETLLKQAPSPQTQPDTTREPLTVAPVINEGIEDQSTRWQQWDTPISLMPCQTEKTAPEITAQPVQNETGKTGRTLVVPAENTDHSLPRQHSETPPGSAFKVTPPVVSTPNTPHTTQTISTTEEKKTPSPPLPVAHQPPDTVTDTVITPPPQESDDKTSLEIPTETTTTTEFPQAVTHRFGRRTKIAAAFTLVLSTLVLVLMRQGIWRPPSAQDQPNEQQQVHRIVEQSAPVKPARENTPSHILQPPVLEPGEPPKKQETTITAKEELVDTYRQGVRKAIKDGHLQDAASLLQEAEEIAPGDPRIDNLRKLLTAEQTRLTTIHHFFEQANVLQQKKRYSQALVILEKIQALDPDNQQARQLKTHITKAMATKPPKPARAEKSTHVPAVQHQPAPSCSTSGDSEIIKVLLELKTGLSNLDIPALNHLSRFKPSTRSKLETLASNYVSLDIKLDGMSYDKARCQGDALLQVKQAFNDSGDVVIPSPTWKTYKLQFKRKNDQWIAYW